MRFKNDKDVVDPSLISSSEVFAILSAVSLKSISSIFLSKDSPNDTVESASSPNFYSRKSSF